MKFILDLVSFYNCATLKKVVSKNKIQENMIMSKKNLKKKEYEAKNKY